MWWKRKRQLVPPTPAFELDEVVDVNFTRLDPRRALAVLDAVMAHCRVEWASHGNAAAEACWDAELGWEELRARFLPERLFDMMLSVRCPVATLGSIQVTNNLLIMVGLDDACHFRPQSNFPDACFIELSFGLSAVDTARWGTLVADLHEFASRVQIATGAPEIFAGIEPGYHEDMRLFTGSALGPVRIDEGGVHF